MKWIRIIILCLLPLLFSQELIGQNSKPEIEFNKYFKSLKKNNIDSVLVIKSSCVGCETKYKDVAKAVSDGVSIYVLNQYKGQYKLAIFDDLHEPKYFGIDTCSLFSFISNYKECLKQKECFYKSELPKIRSELGFYPPKPMHYFYDDLSIHLPDFSYSIKIRDHDQDYLGIQRNDQKWFIISSEIIQRINLILKSINE